jgi:hypothetical protein
MRKSKYIRWRIKNKKNGEENLAEAREKLLLKTGGSNRDYIRSNTISLVAHKLVVFQSVANNKELLMLIVDKPLLPIPAHRTTRGSHPFQLRPMDKLYHSWSVPRCGDEPSKSRLNTKHQPVRQAAHNRVLPHQTDGCNPEVMYWNGEPGGSILP